MEILNPYIEEFREIKICRLCGSNNKENIDIFTSKPISSRSEDLLTKILTVYPLVLYKNDPLPQHICPKCIGNVSRTYQDIQQVMRQQNKWMNITKAVQPEHKYFHILDVVENSTKTTKENIKSSFKIEINNIPLGKFLATAIKENHNQNNTAVTTNNRDNVSETVVKNIQNKLESNGFTIKRIKVPTSNNDNKDFNANNDAVIKSAHFVTCKYCKQKFSDPKILAQHQLTHLKLSMNKVFQKHLLPKNLRRGRLVNINGNKCIRCLNCWRIHTDNKAILQHWSEGECEFYCFVCGKEFPHSPKMLREHVTESHGVSYSSIKSEFMTNNLQHMNSVFFAETTLKPPNPVPIHFNAGMFRKPVYKKPPPKSCTKNDDGTITCKICHKVFDNFRSSNSHMRKHKPPNRFREPVYPYAALDNYNTEDNYEGMPSTSGGQEKYRAPCHKEVMKTKTFQKRHDFPNNYDRNDCHLTQTSMTSPPDVNDDDDDENLIVPELLTSAIKSERMLSNKTHKNGSAGLEYGDYASSSLKQIIKSEPLDNSEYMLSEEPRLCFICNESFASTREYELHAMFVHNIN